MMKAARPASNAGGTRSRALYLTSLEISNIRAFGPKQHLKLSDGRGKPAPWTLIIGENGTGKTTLLQCLARMQPFPQWERGSDGEVIPGADSDPEKEPGHVEPDLLQDEDPAIERLIRNSPSRLKSEIRATWLAGEGLGSATRQWSSPVHIGVIFESENGELKTYSAEQDEFTLPKPGPLIIGYGAARQIGHQNRSRVQSESSTASLFKDSTDLYDAEEILRDLHHAALDAKDKKTDQDDQQPTSDEKRLDLVLAAVADLLPEKKPDHIRIRGPRVPGRDASDVGVHVLASGNWIPLHELSIGYQTVFAWTVDLAWRLIERYSKSENPMKEPAVVLIDEIDLHLHPRWQRDLRSRLSDHFPNVQFIATTHSPFTAQEALQSRSNLCLVCELDGDRGSEIISDPIPSGDWRVDQIATSKLFGYISRRSQKVEEELESRRKLVKKVTLTPEEEAELKRLDSVAASLPTASSPEDQQLQNEARDLARRIEARRKHQ